MREGGQREKVIGAPWEGRKAANAMTQPGPAGVAAAAVAAPRPAAGHCAAQRMSSPPALGRSKNAGAEKARGARVVAKRRGDGASGGWVHVRVALPRSVVGLRVRGTGPIASGFGVVMDGPSWRGVPRSHRKPFGDVLGLVHYAGSCALISNSDSCLSNALCCEEGEQKAGEGELERLRRYRSR